MSQARFNFETQFEVVVDDLMQSDLYAGIRYGLRRTDRRSIADADPFLSMAALIRVNYLASQNALRANFVRHKEVQGWSVTLIDKDEALANEGAALLKLGKKLQQEEEVIRLMEATTLSEVAYRKLKRRSYLENSPISQAERYDMRRTGLELFYRQDTSKGLIQRDNHLRYRRKVLLYEALQKHVGDPAGYIDRLPLGAERAIQRTHMRLIKDRQIAAALLDELLRLTPLYRDGKFLAEVEYSHNDLASFAERSVAMKRFVEGQFDLATRSDVEKKPMQHLGKILDLVGLRHGLVRTTKSGGAKTHHYALIASELGFLEEIVEARRVEPAWKRLNERYGFEYSDEDYDWLYKYA